MNRILDYLKKRAKVEAAYVHSLDKLNKSFALPKPKKSSKKDAEPAASEMRPMLRLWELFMERMEESVNVQRTFADQLERNLSENLRDFKKNFEGERHDWFVEYKKRYEDLKKSYGSFEMAVSNRETIMKKVDQAKQKYADVDSSKKYTKLEVERARDEYNSRLHKFNEIVEELEAIVEAVSEKEEVFFSTYVPSAFDLLEALETRRIEFTAGKIVDIVQSQKYHEDQKSLVMETATSLIREIKASDEISYIVERNKSNPPTEKPCIKNHAAVLGASRHLVRNPSKPGSNVRKSPGRSTSRKIGLPLTDDDIFKCPPEKLRRRAEKRIMEIEEEIAQIEKQRKGIESLFNTYSVNPKFGDLQTRLDAEKEM